MDFTLGILTGISLSLTVHQLLYIRDLRRKRKEQEELLGPTKSVRLTFTPPSEVTNEMREEHYRRSFMAACGLTPELLKSIRLTDDDLRYVNHSDELSLSIRLKAALEREDFEEAARIRDLMNKK